MGKSERAVELSFFAIHWPGNKHRHWIQRGGDRAACGLLPMPGASLWEWDGPGERLDPTDCPRCIAAMERLAVESKQAGGR